MSYGAFWPPSLLIRVCIGLKKQARKVFCIVYWIADQWKNEKSWVRKNRLAYGYEHITHTHTDREILWRNWFHVTDIFSNVDFVTRSTLNISASLGKTFQTIYGNDEIVNKGKSRLCTIATVGNKCKMPNGVCKGELKREF